ncbi:hypothetical protein FACS1894208_12530 [Clostridia bacterium]|nr:hypothetical protein FACS1894208_12530 [Clostridia bacterium]
MSLFSYIGNQFHKPTGIGGRLATFTQNRMNQRQYIGTETVLELKADDMVLDIGFGNGYVMNRLAKQYPCRFYGIDVSLDMLAVASNRNKKHIDNGRMVLSLGSAEQSGLSDELLDKIYTINTAYFWTSLDAGLAEIHRILKPGGLFVNTVYSKAMLDSLPMTKNGYAKYELDEYVKAGSRNGFSTDVKPIVNGRSYCVIYKKLVGG